MSTRRKIAAALVGLPLISRAAKVIEIDPADKKPEPQSPEPLRANPIIFDASQISEDAVRIISYTIYAEARGEPFEGMKAVAAVINTRSRELKLPMPDVCLQEKQFSCWNSISAVPPYYASGAGLRSADVKARSNCYGLAWLLVSGNVKWEYLTHFYNPDLASPSWRHEMGGVRTIGNHVFGYIR
jgi:spore germination cell wall hydrolase CwlJ-like protein